VKKGGGSEVKQKRWENIEWRSGNWDKLKMIETAEI
jgi:hypothetical protein